jgi:hypothetical protein
MLDLPVMDGDGWAGAGRIQFGKAHPDDTVAHLIVTNHLNGDKATVLLAHNHAVALMAQLGAFIATT